MKNNSELQKDIQESIKWIPLLKNTEIGVSVNNGIVTLTGTVDSYSQKVEAENATKYVAGVKAVVEKIVIKFKTGTAVKDDNELAREIINVYRWNRLVPRDKIRVKVENGWITLEGEVQWNYQREAARDTLINILDVVGVSNNITLKPQIQDNIEKHDIENALQRNWTINNKDIAVKVNGNTIKLTGTVNSWFQRDEAARIAWNAPGVFFVDNELKVNYDYSMPD